jgi:desulfoferrodoxin (superoxide reductase-like protein)
MKNHLFLGVFIVLILAALIVIPTGCAKEEKIVGEEQTAEKEEPASAEAEEKIFTRSDPGAWGGKEDSHIPQIVYEKVEAGLKVTVTVSHEMNPEKPHYIMLIKLKDGEGNLLGEKEFQAADEKAEAIFELSTLPGKLVAYEKCNLHGVWMDEVVLATE